MKKQSEAAMLVRVFGPGCARCAETERIVLEAVEASGCNAEVRKVTDFREMMAAGVLTTPAVAVNDTLLCSGRVPEKEEVLDWLRRA